jgi:hypothetical protein
MSKSRGLDILDPGYADPRIPVMDHIQGLSREALIHFTGIDPIQEPHRLNETFRTLCEIFEVDLLWGSGLPDDPAAMFDWSDGETTKTNPEGNPVVQWGIFGATAQVDGGHYLQIPRPAGVDEALAFEPLAHFPKSVEEYHSEFEEKYAHMLETCGEVCYPIPDHYTTCFHWALAIFGFELLCEAGLEEDRFAELMSRFAEISIRVTTAWSRVEGLQALILHDDLTMTRGPIFSPDWYRRHIFVHYPEIFRPLKEAGIPIIFTSDGNCTEFVEDIFHAGADGLNMEYMVDLARLAADYSDKILIGNMNSAVLAHGPDEAIEEEVRRCIEAGARAPRFVANVGGQLTHDIPRFHLETYLDARKACCRAARAGHEDK